MALKFSKHHADEPEINLIPFIDVLLVVLIFLMMTTTYSKYTELQVNLPTADADRPSDNPKEVVIVVSADGHFAVSGKTLTGRNVDMLAAEVAAAAGGSKDIPVIISADAATPHQAVIVAMDAARRAGLVKLRFAGQGSLNP